MMTMMIGMMGLGWIVPLLLIGVVASALGLRPRFNQVGLAETIQTPIETLKARYGGGEISRGEYEQVR